MKKLLLLCISTMCALFAVSCEKEWNGSAVNEGMPVRSLSLKIDIPSEIVNVSTKANNVTIDYDSFVIVLIPKVEGGQSKVFGSESFTLTDNSSVSKNIKFNFSNNEVTGGQYYLYAFANLHSSWISNNLCGKTKQEIDEMRLPTLYQMTLPEGQSVYLSGRYCQGSSTDGSVTLFGEDPETSTGGSNKLSGVILMRRMTARIHFDFKGADGIEFVPKSYSIYNYPSTTFPMEREGWNGTDPGTLDDAVVADSTDDASIAGDDLFFSVKNNPIAEDGVIEFYMFPNAQHALGNPANYKEREAHVSATDQSFRYAPERATYIVVKGTYKDSLYTGDVTYTIHPGDFSKGTYSNFSVRRNYRYEYHITVNGVKNIVAECESQSFYEPQPGAEGILAANSTVATVELHASGSEAETVSLDKSLLKNCKILVQTSYNAEIKVDPSPENKALESDCSWVRFSKPSDNNDSDVEAETCDIYGLLEDVNNEEWKYCTLTKDGKISVTVEADEISVPPVSVATKVIVVVPKYNERFLALATGYKISLDKKSCVTEGHILTVKQDSN